METQYFLQVRSFLFFLSYQICLSIALLTCIFPFIQRTVKQSSRASKFRHLKICKWQLLGFTERGWYDTAWEGLSTCYLLQVNKDVLLGPKLLQQRKRVMQKSLDSRPALHQTDGHDESNPLLCLQRKIWSGEMLFQVLSGLGAPPQSTWFSSEEGSCCSASDCSVEFLGLLFLPWPETMAGKSKSSLDRLSKHSLNNTYGTEVGTMKCYRTAKTKDISPS